MRTSAIALAVGAAALTAGVGCTTGDSTVEREWDEPGMRQLVEDEVADARAVIIDPGLGRRPRCTLPARRCTGPRRHCHGLVDFLPRRGPGYLVTTLPGEGRARRSASWLRRDLVLLVKYAAAKVDCEAARWPGSAGPLELGDMSQRSGQRPGSWDFAPRHPPSTHERGTDIDVAYYQLGTGDNRMRAICPHTYQGHDRLHCVAEPTALDAMRTALFVGALLEAPFVRVVGVDGLAGPQIEAALRRLCRARWISTAACRRMELVLVYERIDTGLGWYFTHHHHVHVGAFLP